MDERNNMKLSQEQSNEHTNELTFLCNTWMFVSVWSPFLFIKY